MSRFLNACLLLLVVGVSGTEPIVEKVNAVIGLNDENFDVFLQGERAFVKFFAPWCGHCQAIAPTWEALAEKLPDLLIAEVDCTRPDSKRTCDRLNVGGFPTLKLFEDNLVYEHEGGRTEEDLRSFALEGYKQTTSSPLPPPLEPEPQESDQNVVVVTDENISTIEEGGKTVLLEFYAPWCGHCNALAPTYNKLANVLAESHPEIVVAKMDATQAPVSTKRYGLTGFPTIMMLKDEKMVEYHGSREVEAMTEFLLKPMEGGAPLPAPLAPEREYTDQHVVVATDENIVSLEQGGKTVMMEFYAPWCGHCNALVPTYNKLATTLSESHPDIVVAKMDATKAPVSAKRYELTGFPTIWVFKGGKMVEYNGKREVEAMTEFLLNPTGDMVDIPLTPGAFNDFWGPIFQVFRDLITMFSRQLMATFVVFLFGVCSGYGLRILHVKHSPPKEKGRKGKPPAAVIQKLK